MKHCKLILISIIGFFICNTVFASSTRIIEVQPKQGVFEISLPANQTTGYQWSLINYNTKILKSIGQNYQQAESRLVGAGGYTRFYFQCLNVSNLPNYTQLKFAYKRSWEPRPVRVTTIQVHFKK